MDLLSMVNTAVITTAAVSAAVSALVTLLLRVIFENRLKHHFDKELEKLRHTNDMEIEKVRHAYELDIERLKSQLAVGAETAKEIISRRLAVYTRVVELIYRTRNMARELASEGVSSAILIDELKSRVIELEETIFASRLDLERDGVFLQVHAYKNLLKAFVGLQRDLVEHQNRGDSEDMSRVSEQIQSLYREIEKEQQPIIDALSRQIPSMGETNQDLRVADSRV